MANERPAWRTPPRDPLHLADGSSMDTLWPRQVLGPFIDEVNQLRAEARAKVLTVVGRLLAGKPKAWCIEGAKGQRGELWELAVEVTPVTDTAYLVWWVELEEADGQQYIVIYRLVKAADLEDARVCAANFLRTFSDGYLRASLGRKRGADGNVLPMQAAMDFAVHRDALEEVTQRPGCRPVSLEKRYRMTEQHLRLLKDHSLKRIQLPYVMDGDEQEALEKVLHEPLFLLGRSGSGKTSVQVHALYYLQETEREWGLQRPTQEQEEALPGPVLLVTRSAVLSASIRKVLQQMVAGLEEREAGAPEGAAATVALGVLGDEEAFGNEELPTSFHKNDLAAGTSPLVASWASFLAAADASFPHPHFFRRVQGGHVQRALRRLRAAGGGDGGSTVLEAEDRFPHLVEGSYDFGDELSFEMFEARFGPKLLGGPLARDDSLFVVYKEILTVIAGSLRAVRSRAGCLSQEEYVTGRDASGAQLPELRDSAVQDEATRLRIYKAYEVYVKLKVQAGKYDRTDPVRHITQRACKFRKKKRAEEFRMLSSVFVDEVQDLLPAEILLLRLFCQHNNGWIFAGDTAQTISKGVEFRFESIRRLFFEEFLAGKDWAEEEGPAEERPTCTICSARIVKAGGVAFECHSHYEAHAANVCGPACYDSFVKRSEDSLKTAGESGRRKREWAQARGKLNCPMPGCALYMKEAPIPEEEVAEEDEEEMVAAPRSLQEMPDVHHLTHNHRSTRGILDLAGSIIDVLVDLFPDKIDKLPREVSLVDARMLPVFISGMSLDEALDIVFQQGTNGTAAGTAAANDNGQRVLEFGARQAVLVWSDAARDRVKQRFPMSIVMTIHDCKGLEFEDVLIISPFSDMSSSAQGRSAQLWRLIYHHMMSMQLQVDPLEAKRVPAFDPAAHGLLCGWLKALYVAVTRARQRVWLLEEGEAGRPMLAYWQAAGVVRLVSSAEEAQVAPEFEGGFVAVSTAEDFVEQGQAMLQNRKYDQATLLFTRAQRAGHHGAGFWRAFSLGSQKRHQASLQEGVQANQSQQEAAAAFAGLANELLRAPEEHRPAQLHPEHLWLLAATCYVDGLAFRKAAPLYSQAGDHENAATCWEAAQEWRKAGDSWRQGGRAEAAMRAYVRGQAWSPFVEVAERPADMAPNVLHELVRRVVREMGKVLAKQAPRAARGSTAWQLVLRCIVLLPQGPRRTTFVTHLRIPGLELELMELEGRLGDCAACCMKQLDWDGAQRYQERAGRADLAQHMLLLRSLRELGVVPSCTSPRDRVAAIPVAELTEEQGLGNVVHHLCQLHDWVQAADGRAKAAAWREFWSAAPRVAQSNPGHALRLQAFALVLAAQEPGKLGVAPMALKTLRPQFSSLKGTISELRQSMEESLSASRVQQHVFELLLVEQPPLMQPSYLVLADVLPAGTSSCQLSLDQVLRLAEAVLSLLELQLHWEFFLFCQQCIQGMVPCWSSRAHGTCLTPGCQAPHAEGAVPPQQVADAIVLTFNAWDGARRLSESVAVARASDILGRKSRDLVGWQHGLEGLQERIRRGGEWLLAEALLPATPATALLPLGAPALAEATGSLLRAALDSLVMDISANRRPPQLQDLLAAPGALVFCHLVDYHAVPALGDLLRSRCARWDRSNPARLLLDTYTIAQAASPSGRLAGAQEPKYNDLLNFFHISHNVAIRLCCDWDNFAPPDGNTVFPVPPHVVCHLLERVVVWANVLLTRFSNTTLPESYVREHLACHGRLAALAAENSPPYHERHTIFRAWESVLSHASRLLRSPARFRAWVRGHNASYGGTALRVLTAMFTCGSVNWLRFMRNQHLRHSIMAISLTTRLEFMNEGMEFGPSSLPQQLQWLVAGVPRDEAVQVDGSERNFDRLTPWFHSVLSQLGDPFVMLHRSDSQDAPAGWTKANRPLEFHREEFLAYTNPPGKHLRILVECLSRRGPAWPSEWVSLRWPSLRRLVVFRPSRDASTVWCDFSELDRREPAAARINSEEPQEPEAAFVLDKDTRGAGQGGSAEDFECEADEQAAAALAIAQRPVPLRIVVQLRLRLRAARKGLAVCLSEELRGRVAEAWLLEAGASGEERECYLRKVLPVLQRHYSESNRLYAKVRQEVAQRTDSSKEEVVEAANQALDGLDELQALGDGFCAAHERVRVGNVHGATAAAALYWEARVALLESLLKPALQILGLEEQAPTAA